MSDSREVAEAMGVVTCTICRGDVQMRYAAGDWVCPECGGSAGSAEEDMVNHPSHYGGEDNPYEAIKVIEAWQLGFHLGNTVKYVSRAGKKGRPLEDLQKAAWYLQREIQRLTAEAGQPSSSSSSSSS